MSTDPTSSADSPSEAVVIDASVVVAALTDRSDVGEWSRAIVVEHVLVAPQIVHAEVTNVLRRAESGRRLTADAATVALRDLLRLPIELLAFEPVATRVWELRGNVTAYDAWYVAAAESLDASMATLDQRLADSPGPRCPFLLPS